MKNIEYKENNMYVYAKFTEEDIHVEFQIPFYNEDNNSLDLQSCMYNFEPFTEKMIPMNYFLNCVNEDTITNNIEDIEDLVLGFFKNVSNITKWKYTFQKEGIPYCTVIGREIKYY